MHLFQFITLALNYIIYSSSYTNLFFGMSIARGLPDYVREEQIPEHKIIEGRTQMRKTVKVSLVVLALALALATPAFADDVYYANGVVNSFTENSIVVVLDGESISLSINDDTEISGKLTVGADVYVEWKENVALYIEVAVVEN